MGLRGKSSLFDLEAGWENALADEFEKGYFDAVEKVIDSGEEVYPPRELIFEAFRRTPFDSVKVVIVGQDPYHGKGQAQGLSFSVPKGVSIPPSLRNIFKELHDDTGFVIPDHGCLIPWAEQGVLLLNATLTVKPGEPLSHHGIGWERFTDAVVQKLASKDEPIIFVLWGKSAQMKGEKCLKNSENASHLVLEAAHPSPFSAYRGFFGCRHFSKVNELLKSHSQLEVDWSL